MKNLVVLTMVFFSGSVFAESGVRREIRELNPFANTVQTVSGVAKNFNISSYGIKNLTTRLEVIEREDCYEDPSCTQYRVLASEKALQLTFNYTDHTDVSEETPELTFNFKWNELPVSIQNEVAKESGGLGDVFGKKHRVKMKFIRDHFLMEMKEYPREVQLIDYARSKICYDFEYPETNSTDCKDDIVYKTIVRTFKDVTLVPKAE